MADLLKHVYNDHFFSIYTTALKKVLPDFNLDQFMASVRDDSWESKELKQRMAHLTLHTGKLLPTHNQEKVTSIYNIVNELRKNGVNDQNFPYLFMADLIPASMLDDLQISIPAIAFMTVFTSFEFAGRPYFVQYPEGMMAQMLIWSKHPNPYVRRYASEGCRPRLPWGLQLKQFVIDPTPIIPILENLKDDPSEYVRKSVANNLNDISKDHPDLVVDIIKKWKGKSKNTDWILKHASRTLLKRGHHEVLDLFGTSAKTMFELSHFGISHDQLSLGDTLTFDFKIVNKEQSSAKFRIEFAIHFVKSNGQRSKKIFKIAEPTLSEGEILSGTKKHRFIDLTTRKHYRGTHKIALVVNGLESEGVEFELKV
jgi:3-methyladenine DNA glycosylase AlkC